MIRIIDKSKCCGCEACVQICPKHCISLYDDEEGFRYPKVDINNCVDCGLCENACPILHNVNPFAPLRVYAIKNMCREELLASSSGGLFILIAKKTITDGGVVFGARFDEKWAVEHAYTEIEKGLEPFMGSKYIQSRIGNCYNDVKTFLKTGRKVLFTGTSCQVAGLKNFLGKEYDNLLTADVVCHGVPSPMVWQRYLDEIKEKAQMAQNKVLFSLIGFFAGNDASLSESDVEIKRISFRDKKFGWKKFSLVVTLSKTSANGKKKTVLFTHKHWQDPYMRAFLANLSLRPSCYHCPLKGGHSQSDLTMADYWGIENFHPTFYEKKGVGLLIVNTNRGLSSVMGLNMEMLETDMLYATKMNPSYYKSVIEPENRIFFWSLLYKGERISEIVKVLLGSLFIRRANRVLKNARRKFLRIK